MLIGVAGIPAVHFNRFQQRVGTIAGSGHTVFGVPCRPTDGTCRPDEDTARAVIEKAVDQINKDPRRAADGFGVICLAHPWADLTAFQTPFFPAALVLRIDLPFPLVLEGEAGRIYINNVLRAVQTQSSALVRATRAMKTEVETRRNRSPVLLPLRNFTSELLRPSVERLAEDLLTTANPSHRVQAACQQIEAGHPFKPNGAEKGFKDDADVIFRSPGRDLHGQLWEKPGNGHDERCALHGHFRLGGPIAQGFHFDCTRPPRLKGRFENCHDAEAEYTGKPHLNIAPNDFVRQ